MPAYNLLDSKQKMPQRKWKHFPGSNRFYCNGLLMSANQMGVLLFLIILLVVMSTLFFAFDCRFLIQYVHPATAPVAVVGVVLLFYCMMFLLKAGCTDPGFIPRARPDEATYNKSIGDVDPTNTAKGYVGTPAKFKTVVVNGESVKLKFCVTCNIYRPPRASHCGLCNNCVEIFDHHCPAVGNCVARRNYRYFYLFLNMICYSCLYVVGVNVAVIVLASQQIGFVNAIKTYPASIIEFLIAGFTILSVSGLAMFHTNLICRMKTTNEDLKGTFAKNSGRKNPYSRTNMCSNFLAVVCGPFPISLIDRRGFVDEEMLREEEQSYGAVSPIPQQASEPSEAAEPRPATDLQTVPSASVQQGSVDIAVSTSERSDDSL